MFLLVQQRIDRNPEQDLLLEVVHSRPGEVLQVGKVLSVCDEPLFFQFF